MIKKKNSHQLCLRNIVNHIPLDKLEPKASEKSYAKDTCYLRFSKHNFTFKHYLLSNSTNVLENSFWEPMI